MLGSLERLLGEDPEKGWHRLKTVCEGRAELRLPTVYGRLNFADLRESQAKKVMKILGVSVKSDTCL